MKRIVPIISGGWTSRTQYFLQDGKTPATEDPVADDVVVIPEGTTVFVSSDADASFVNSLHGVYLKGKTSEFVFDQPSPIDWKCSVCGYGRIIKRTAATISLQPNTSTDVYGSMFYDYYPAYHAGNGFVVETGVLIAPVASETYSFGALVLSNDTAFVVSPNGATVVTALNGYGMVTNPAVGGNSRSFMIGVAGYEHDWMESHFYGELVGDRMTPAFCGSVYMHGTNSTCGATPTVWGRREGDYRWGTVRASRFGIKYKPSSVGTVYQFESRYAGGWQHIGDQDDVTDKTFYWMLTDGQAPVTFDAGFSGSLTFNESAVLKQYEASYLMGRVLFTGDNTTPCVVAGKIKTDVVDNNNVEYTSYFTKEGSGTWRLKNADNSQKGVLAVKNGTLQFDSIAEAGERCSLGLSTVLYADFCGAKKLENAVDYAFLLAGNGTIPTLEYVGGRAASCSTRTLALAGDGGRLSVSGAGSALDFSGVCSAESGEKVLTLGGDSTGPNVLRNVRSGDGAVAVAKDGPGTWTLRGTNEISGVLHVKEGVLKLRDRFTPPNYSWYRLVLKGTSSTSGIQWVSQFALYDEAGSNRVAGLRHHYPPASEGGTKTGYFAPAAISDLLPGEVLAWGVNSSVYIAGDNHDLQRFVDGGGSGDNWRSIFTGLGFNPDVENSWGYVVVRVPVGTPAITHWDFSPGKVSYFNCVAVDGSTDGINWDHLTENVTVADGGTYGWVSGASYSSGVAVRPLDGFNPDFKIASHAASEPDDGGSTVLDGVTSVRVDAGAILCAEGARKEARGLTVDCVGGCGTLKGIDFAPDGILTVVNWTRGTRELTIPIDLSDATDVDLVNLNGYSISVNGQVRTDYSFKATRTSIEIVAPGMLLIVK